MPIPRTRPPAMPGDDEMARLLRGDVEGGPVPVPGVGAPQQGQAQAQARGTAAGTSDPMSELLQGPAAPLPGVGVGSTPASSYQSGVPNAGQLAATVNPDVVVGRPRGETGPDRPVTGQAVPAGTGVPGAAPLPPAVPQLGAGQPQIIAGGGQTPTPAPAAGGTNYGEPGAIEAWAAQRGVTLNPTSAEYWRTQWNDWGHRAAPGYFEQRLGEMEEIIGMPGTAGNPGYGGGGGGQFNQYQTDPMVQEAIRKLLAQGQTPVTGDEPGIRAQFNPTSQVIQRNRDRSKASAAERNFAQGQTGDSANDLVSAQIDQASGLDEANLMGDLVATELSARRQDVVNALNFAQGEERMALQSYLSSIDSELRRLQMGQQNQQFYDTLGYTIGRDEAEDNRSMLALLMSGSA